MILATFIAGSSSEPSFGICLNNRLYSLKDLCREFNISDSVPENINEYCSEVNTNFALLKDIEARLRAVESPETVPSIALDDAFLLPAVQKPAALLDFGLSPEHLANSARTLIKHEFSWPLSVLISAVIARKMKKIDTDVLKYYKGNHNEISGPGDTLHWPDYTSYLDIEPELAFITGIETKGKEYREPVIVGYTILNDVSARDVQFPEMTALGPTRSKDFHKSNGLGPFVVTPDEISTPLDLSVKVKTGSRFEWNGSTSGYCAHPVRVLEYCGKIFNVMPGTVIGMGTVPGCCGLDNDLWLHPGDPVEITINGLGCLKQYIPVLPDTLEKSRWQERKDIES